MDSGLTFPFIIEGSNPGPTSVILAGIHGNEPCGIIAFERILPSLKINSGKVIFEIGNPLAINKNVRFVDINLNRMMLRNSLLSESIKTTYEYFRSREIMKLLDSADALLDIHSSRNPKSEQFVICESNSMTIASVLPVTTVCVGFDAFEPGATDGYMKDKIGVCIECGQHLDPRAPELAEKAIHTFLLAMGHVDGEKPEVQKQKVLNIFHLHTNEKPFTRTRPFADFESITEGTVIGYDGDTPIISPKDCIILFALDTQETGKECFLLAENIN